MEYVINTLRRHFAEPLHRVPAGVSLPFHYTSDRLTGGAPPTDQSEFEPLRQRIRGPNGAILVIDRSAADGERMVATLRVLFGYQVRIGQALSMREAVEHLGRFTPNLTLLGDTDSKETGADDTASLAAMTQLRGAGYGGAVIVVTGRLNKSQRAHLLSAGAIDAIHKDELCSERIAEALRPA